METKVAGTRKLEVARLAAALAAVMFALPGGASAMTASDFELETGSCSLTSSCVIVGGDFTAYPPTTFDVLIEMTGPSTASLEFTDLTIPDVNVVPSFVTFDVVADSVVGEITTSGPDAGKVEFDPFEISVGQGGSAFSLFVGLTTETVSRPRCGAFVGDTQSGSRLDFATGELVLIGSACPSNDLLFTLILAGNLDPALPGAVPEPTTLALLGVGVVGLAALGRRRR